jgi:hypothetical protein
MKLSVIICTHNPRREYLERALDALREQTLPLEQWELLLIDNASDQPLAGKWDLSWHPQGRHIRENELGLTAARLRGIGEAQGDLLVFVDDDNLLQADFLMQNQRIGIEHPWIGCWGGRIEAEFETPPPEHLKPYLQNIAIRDVSKPIWIHVAGLEAANFAPCGAGLAIRRGVAAEYAGLAMEDPRRKSLGRRGNALTSAEDTDIALTACDLGLAVGQFPQLCLTHLIPAARLTDDYFVRLQEALFYSLRILCWVRELPFPLASSATKGRVQKLLGFYVCWRNFLNPQLTRVLRFQKRMEIASVNGVRRAERWIASQPPSGNHGKQ